MKKHFNKELVITKEDYEDFENSTKCWICDNAYVEGDQCHINGKYRTSTYREFDITIKLNHKIPIVFQKLKNYDSHLIMQKLGKLDFKINLIPNGLEKYMSFNISNRLIFIDTFQLLSYLLGSLVQNFGKDNFKYFSQEFGSKVLDLVM